MSSGSALNLLCIPYIHLSSKDSFAPSVTQMVTSERVGSGFRTPCPNGTSSCCIRVQTVLCSPCDSCMISKPSSSPYALYLYITVHQTSLPDHHLNLHHHLCLMFIHHPIPHVHYQPLHQQPLLLIFFLFLYKF